VLASCAFNVEGKLAATVPPAQPVSDRAYFTDARESRLWALDGCHEHFAVESVRTRSDGTTSSS